MSLAAAVNTTMTEVKPTKTGASGAPLRSPAITYAAPMATSGAVARRLTSNRATAAASIATARKADTRMPTWTGTMSQ